MGVLWVVPFVWVFVLWFWVVWFWVLGCVLLVGCVGLLGWGIIICVPCWAGLLGFDDSSVWCFGPAGVAVVAFSVWAFWGFFGFSAAPWADF